MGYLYLFVAILLEVLGTNLIKKSDGFSSLASAFWGILAYSCCLFCLSKAFQSLPVVLVYAYWCALGVLLVTLSGVFIWREPVTLTEIAGLGLLTLGILLMNSGHR